MKLQACFGNKAKIATVGVGRWKGRGSDGKCHVAFLILSSGG